MMIIIIIYQTTRPQKGASQSALASSSQVTHQVVVNYNNKKMHACVEFSYFKMYYILENIWNGNILNSQVVQSMISISILQ